MVVQQAAITVLLSLHRPEENQISAQNMPALHLRSNLNMLIQSRAPEI
jgi:hypothetical protein